MVIDTSQSSHGPPAGARPVKRPVEELERIGGRLCLDLTNTVGGSRENPSEWLVDYPALVRWSVRAGALDAADADALLEAAGDRPEEASEALRATRELRESLFRVFDALAGKRAVPPEDVARLNAHLGPALARLQVAPSGDGFAWRDAGPDELALDAMLGPIARDAAELLVAGDPERIKECGGKDCTWLFVDASKNRSRRWCDMRDCGNRAKARRHYRRQKRARS